MPFDITKFVVCRAVAENANPDTNSADRVAILTSMMNMGLVQSAILASALAGNEVPVPAAGGGGVPSARLFSRRRRPLALANSPVPRVKVPHIRHLKSESEIHEHLGHHHLRARIHAERAPELKEPRIIFQSPEPDEEIDPDGEVTVVLLTPVEPEGVGHGEQTIPRRK
jgi:hypothetical protein